MYDCPPLDVLDQVHLAPSSSAAVPETCPEGARGFLISAATQDAIVSLDGTTATATNGLRIKTGAPAMYIPIARDLSIIGTNATASAVDIVWVR